MIKLNLGCGPDYRQGYLNVDWNSKLADANWDLTKLPWPIHSDSCSEVLMQHVLEHLPDTLGTLREITRVLAPGGIFHGKVPFALSENAFTEPDHVRYFMPGSFRRLAEINHLQLNRAALVVTSPNALYALRNVVTAPFRWFTRHWLLNQYDEIHFELQKS